ncbi:RNA-directed DNA polymerase [Brasilonema sp. CT11]|nr:RNA-directed DNA polymerase [Brasilonema sp. CT11]
MTIATSLWNKFATYDNFLLAWQRTVNVTSRMVHDELGMKLFAHNLQANLENLVQRVVAEDFPYQPLADHKVYVPKPSSTLRTMSLMAVPDVIVYQALVNIIADQAYLYLVSHENQCVLGNLYAGPGKRWMLKPWKKQYTRFVNRVEKLYSAGNPWIASTDIVAFYDTIDHACLLSIIRKYCGEDRKFEQLFLNCLEKWAVHNVNIKMSRGIPQGSNASDFLANLFLHEIDKKMIVHGYQYVRYVDDVRILGAEKSTVQRGLILFDLELKRAGLVAQVTKTSVHKIENLEKEISRLRFRITDPTGKGNCLLVTIPSPPKSEQADFASDYVKKTSSGYVEDHTTISDSKSNLEDDEKDDLEDDEEITTLSSNKDCDIEQNKTPNLQKQIREKFIEAFALLDDQDRGKEAESNIAFCLYRLEPHPSIREQVLSLLSTLPWRSEAISIALGRFKNDSYVIEGLRAFISEHDVYSWHRANSLWALYQVSEAKSVAPICQAWLADTQLHWYAKVIAARILAEVPGQHAYFMECLQSEQNMVNGNAEETAILRQELAYGAFQRIKSPYKQLALFRLICIDKSPLVQQLVVYLLQQPQCQVTWDDLKEYHQQMGTISELIKKLGLSADALTPCFIFQTLSTMYRVSLAEYDLRRFYAKHYNKAVEQLRESVSNYYQSPSWYIRTFHQFAHVTLIAFCESVLPSESGLYTGYDNVASRGILTTTLPRGAAIWRRLGPMRNRVDHPVDSKTQLHTRKITVKEVEDLHKELQVALQEIFDVWLNSPLPTATTSAVPVGVSIS